MRKKLDLKLVLEKVRLLAKYKNALRKFKEKWEELGYESG